MEEEEKKKGSRWTIFINTHIRNLHSQIFVHFLQRYIYIRAYIYIYIYIPQEQPVTVCTALTNDTGVYDYFLFQTTGY